MTHPNHEPCIMLLHCDMKLHDDIGYFNISTGLHPYSRFQVAFQITSVFLVQNYGMLFYDQSTFNVITLQM